MPKIFISYRRSDSEWAAGRLREALGRHFGDDQIFRDKESIRPGVAWREEIQAALREPSTVVLALIGPRWLSEEDAAGHRLIDRVDDVNRVELEHALQQRLSVIPVLIGDTPMPQANQLPESLRELTALNAVRLRDDDWDSDVRRVTRSLTGLGVAPIEASTSPTSTRWAANNSRMLLIGVIVAAVAVATLLYLQRGGQTPDRTADVPTRPASDTSLEANAPAVQIVIDRSEVMNQAFGQPRNGGAAQTMTKLDEARRSVLGALANMAADDNLSLRIFGGECGAPGNTQLLLPFAPGKTRLEQNVREVVKTFGQSSLVSAVVEATGNFNARRFKQTRSTLIVLTGGYDECGNPDPAAEIRRRLEQYPDVKLDLRFIGVGLRPEAEAQLGALAQALDARLTNAPDPAALDVELQRVLIVQPRVAEVEQVTLTLNEGAAHANTAVSKIGGGDYDAADRALQQAADALARGVVTLPDARQPQAVRELLDLARQRRDEQQQMIDAARALTRASRSSDEAAAAEARRAYNAASARHNRIIGKINELQQQIIKGVVTSAGRGGS